MKLIDSSNKLIDSSMKLIDSSMKLIDSSKKFIYYRFFNNINKKNIQVINYQTNININYQKNIKNSKKDK